MNYFNLSSSTAFLYSLYKYLCCREKVEGLYEGGLYEGGLYEGGLYDGGDYDGGDYDGGDYDGGDYDGGDYDGGDYDGGDYEGVYEQKIYPKLNCNNDNVITPNTNLHSRYQSKKFTFNL
jgi:hypothetical protein